MKKVTFCIPSKGRADKVETIENLGIRNKNTIIFVDSPEEREEYLEYNRCKVVYTKTKGIQHARNAILDYFNIGDYIITLCDDVKGVYELKGKKDLRRLNYTGLIKLINLGFDACLKYGTELWGVYPIKNDFYMSRTIAPAGFVIGTFSGIIVNDIRCDTSLQLKEDYDFTIKNIIRFKKIVRFNYYCVEAKHYNNKGGCVDYRNPEMEKAACDRLLELYPNYVRLNPRRENEVLLKFKKT